jgi:hypothetical protein
MSASTGLASTNGKAPAANPERREPLINVQPPRLEELQPKYAQHIDHDQDNPETHGWYASFSRFFHLSRGFVIY